MRSESHHYVYDIPTPLTISRNHKEANVRYVVQSESNKVRMLTATIYAGTDYGGSNQVLNVGRYDIDQLTIGNDQLSSLKVPEGLLVTLYEHRDFEGRTKKFAEDSSNVGDFNNITSSISVELVAKIFKELDCAGEYQYLPVGRYDLEDIEIGNDQLSSLKIPSGLAVTLYINQHFSGKTKTFTQDTRWVGLDFDKQTSSIEVIVNDPNIPSNVVRFGDKIALQSVHGKYMVAENSNGLDANRDSVGPWEKFTVMRSGTTQHHSFLAFGDTITLKSHHDKYVSAKDTGKLYADVDSLGEWEKFYLIRSGKSTSRNFISTGDTITLRSTHNKYVVAEDDGRANANRDRIGDWVKWIVTNTTPRFARWALKTDGSIYRRNLDGWEHISGVLKQISVGDNNSIWGISNSNESYRWNGSSWTPMNHKLTHVSVGYDDTVWGIEPDDKIVKFNASENKWETMSGLLKQISVGNKYHIWGTSSAGYIFRWNGSSWDHLNQKFAYVSVGADGEAWALNANGQNYRWQDNAFVGKPGILKQISVVNKGMIMGVDNNGEIWQWNGTDWEKLEWGSGFSWISAGMQPFFVDELIDKAIEGGCPTVVCGEANNCNAATCDADACGAAGCELVACAGAACGAFACAPAACHGDGCGAAACAGAVCLLDADGVTGCVGDACHQAIGGISGCALAGCAMAVCGADACGAAICARDTCGAAACGGDACAIEACPSQPCGAQACGGDACAAEAVLLEACAADACAANVCAINLCPADACAADACGLDIIPIIPGI